jgi:hypothetical protein
MLDSRALTLYEEVHPERKLGNVKIQTKFLVNLQSLFPKKCQPIVVTDAGFHNGWFLEVFKLGWHYIGRVRGIKRYQLNGEWRSIKTLVSGGTSIPQFIGRTILCLNNSIITNLYRMKNISKGRKSLNLNKERKNDTQSKKHSKSAKEGWVLATSLPHRKYFSANRVMKIFKKRMQIEEGFRDLKSSRF